MSDEREWERERGSGEDRQGGVNNIDWKGINTLLLSAQKLEVVRVASSEVSSCNNQNNINLARSRELFSIILVLFLFGLWNRQ